jgi:hypothetical protein
MGIPVMGAYAFQACGYGIASVPSIGYGIASLRLVFAICAVETILQSY